MITNEDYLKYEPMIKKIANKYKNNIYKLDIEDLKQIGAIGLIKGFNTYDNTKECKIDTWLYSSIKRAILREFYNLNRIKRQSLINSISIDTPIGATEDNITIADTIEDTNINVSYEAIDNIVEAEYKKEVDLILYGLEHKIAYDYLFKDKSLTEISNINNIKYNKAKNIRDKAFKCLIIKSKFIRNRYLEVKEASTEDNIISLYKDPLQVVYLNEVSKELKDKYKYELNVIDTIQTIFEGLNLYKTNNTVQSFILSLEDILEAKDIFIYKTILEGNRDSLKDKYSFSDIYFIEDRIKKQISYNKNYVYDLWKSYKVKSITTLEKNKDSIYKNEYENITSNQISLFG